MDMKSLSKYPLLPFVGATVSAPASDMLHVHVPLVPLAIVIRYLLRPMTSLPSLALRML